MGQGESGKGLVPGRKTTSDTCHLSGEFSRNPLQVSPRVNARCWLRITGFEEHWIGAGGRVLSPVERRFAEQGLVKGLSAVMSEPG